MFVIDVILAAACVALFATNVRDKRLLRENKKLQSQNGTISQYLLGDGSEGHAIPHDWGDPAEDVIFTSKSPVSYDKVVLEITSCRKCKMISKHIVQGHALAQKKGFVDMEGFFFDGVKTANYGCLKDNDIEEVLE